MSIRESEVDVYDDLAAQYARADHTRFYEGVAAALAGEGDPKLRGSGLDLACGSGASTRPLRRLFPKLRWLGADRARGMLGRLHSRPDLANIPLVRARGEALPLADGALALVACSFALHWMAPTALDEIRRVLAPEGRLLAAIPLRAAGQPLVGNRLLGRALLARRRHLQGPPRVGPTIAELGAALAGWRLRALRAVSPAERYASPDAFVTALQERGVLLALFGGDAPDGEAVLRYLSRPEGCVDFAWPLALVDAHPPAPGAPCSPSCRADGAGDD